MADNKDIPIARGPSSILRSHRREVMTTLSNYTRFLEEEVEQLYSFRSWALPKISEHDVQIRMLRQELNETRDKNNADITCNTPRSPTYAVVDEPTITNTTTSPVTPIIKQSPSVNPAVPSKAAHAPKVHFNDVVVDINVPTELFDTKVDTTFAANDRRTIGIKSNNGKQKTSKRKITAEKRPIHRPCSLQRDTNYFKLTFDETETQSPPNFYAQSGRAACTPEQSDDSADSEPPSQ